MVVELIGKTLLIALTATGVAFAAAAALEIITFSERDEIDD